MLDKTAKYQHLQKLLTDLEYAYKYEYKGIIAKEEITSKIAEIKTIIFSEYGCCVLSARAIERNKKQWEGMKRTLDYYVREHQEYEAAIIEKTSLGYEIDETNKWFYNYYLRVKEINVIISKLIEMGYNEKLSITSTHFNVLLYNNRLLGACLISHLKNSSERMLAFPQPVYLSVEEESIEYGNYEFPSETICHYLIEKEITIKEDYKNIENIFVELDVLSKHPTEII